ALLHFRLVSGWQGKKSAIMTIIGFAALLFTFLGVNLFIESHHQVFTN
ncbi:MAG: c-type cytochrome biogenesis protein CcsB, partial [Desulfobacteraceae bacterium]|nr:c-type cytochrome biogenesis protein CcsB [Desulfobacteraceae bacterium]